MKKKLLSLLLVVAILMTSVSIGFSTMTAYSAGAVGGGAEAINAFSLVESNVSTGSKSYSSEITIKSKLEGYSIKVNYIDTRCLYYGNETDNVVTANNVTGSFPAVQGVTAGDKCDNTEGKVYTVTGTTESAGVVYSTLIRYECNYDLINSKGEVEYAGLTGYGYGAASATGQRTGEVGSYVGNPGLPSKAWNESTGDYSFSTWEQVNTCYVMKDSLELDSVTRSHGGAVGVGSKSKSMSVSGNHPSTLTVASTIYWPGAAWYTAETDPIIWLKLTEPSSGYYNFKLTYDGSTYAESIEMYYMKPTDKSAALTNGNTYLGKNLEKSYYTEASWNKYLKALDMAQLAGRAIAAPDYTYKLACQNAADAAAATSLKAAVAALEPVKAEYKEFNAAKDAFNAKKDDTVQLYKYFAAPDNLNSTNIDPKNYIDLYAKASIAEVESYISSCNTNLYKYQQKDVDNYTATIKNMTENLAYAEAVYTYLDIAIDEIDLMTKDLYETTSWNAYQIEVNKAIEIDRNLKTNSQSTINAAINSIATAKTNLKYAPADTEELKNLMDEGAILEKEYEDGKLINSDGGLLDAWNIYQAAKADAEYAKNETKDHQSVVDEATNNLASAIRGLLNYRVLDTTELRAAVSKNPEYTADKYTTDSYNAWNSLRVEAYLFLAKAEPTYTGTDRKTYNDYDEMIRLAEFVISAYEGLEKVGADFTELDKIIEKIPSDDVLALYQQIYVDAIKNTVAMIDYGAKFDEQADVDEITLNLKYALNELTEEHYREADYTEVDKAEAEAEALDRDIYENFKIVDEAIAAVDRTKNIMQQKEVDAMAQAIRDAIANLEYIPADYAEVEAAIAEAEAIKNKEWYANYGNITNIIDNIDWEKNHSQQEEVDAYAAAIREAIKGLVLAEADYSGVRKAIAEADELDLSKYYAESVENLDLAISKVVAGYTKDRQAEVDAMAKGIEDAIAAMNPLPADYSKANVALDRVSALDPDEYSNFEVVRAAVDALDGNLSILEQDVLDAQVDAIYAAIKELKYLPANYDAVDEAIEAAELALGSGAYPYTAESIQAVRDEIAKVDRSLDITQQDTVDAYILAIDEAVKGLTYIRADYTRVDEALAEYNALNKDLYASLSELDTYVATIDRNITIDRQPEVDAIAARIMELIGALQYAAADYSAVEAAKSSYAALNKSYYKEEDRAAVEAVINAVVEGYTKERQADVDAMAKAINDAIEELKTKILPANLTELKSAVEAANAKISEMSAIGDIDVNTLSVLNNLTYSASRHENSSIDRQEEIDALTLQIIEATENLEYVFTVVITDLIVEESTNVTYIYGFEEGVTEADARELITFRGAAEMVVVEGKNGFGTGTVIQFISTKDGKTVLASYMVLVFGDVDGDSVVDMFDVAYLREVVNTSTPVSDAILRATDVVKDGVLDSNDVVVLTALANMDGTIRQDGTMEVD